METLDGLDLAYNALGRVCDGGTLEGFTPSLDGVSDTLTPEERDFAKWQETLGESAKRFTAATSAYLKENGGGGAVGQFYADNQLIQFCDYAVANWDHIDKAAEVIKQREAALLLQGKMKDLDSNAAALGVQYVTPVKRVSNAKTVVHGISGFYAGEFADSLDRAVEKDRLGVPTGVGDVDDSFIDNMSDEDVMLTAGALGMVTVEDGTVTIDLGRLGVPSEQRVIGMPMYEYVYEELSGLEGDGFEGVEGLDGRWWRNRHKRRAARRERRKQRWQKVKNAFKRAGNWVKRTVKKVASKVKQAAKKVGSKIKQAARYVRDKTKGAFQAVGRALKKAVTFVKNGVTYIWDKTKGFMKKVGNAIVRAAKWVAKGLKTLAQKIAAAFKKWARRLNPKNIIARLVLLRKIKKGNYGIATGAYYGLIGAAESAKLGVRGDKYKESKEAYDKLRSKWNELGGKVSALDGALRMGRNKFDGKIPSKEQLHRDVQDESRDMNAKQLEAQEKEAVKREEGLKGGLGIIATALIDTIVKIFSMIIAFIKKIINFLRQKKARTENEKAMADEQRRQDAEIKDQEKKAQAQMAAAAQAEKQLQQLQNQAAQQGGDPAAFREVRALPDGTFNVVDKRTGAVIAARVSRDQAAALTTPAAQRQNIVKQKASMTRVALLGAVAVGALFIISMIRNGGRQKALTA